MQLIVLGMHRSGTSVLARLLNLMGAYFGAEGVGTGANAENPKGFWERRDVRNLNDHVLHAAGFDWNRVLGFDAARLPPALVDEFVGQASALVLDMDAHRPWLLKEPRLCLLLPLWRKVLEAPVCIHIHRDPAEVAGSLRARNAIPVEVGLALWERYVRAAHAASAGLPSVVVSHRQLMQQPVQTVARLLHQLQSVGEAGLHMPADAEIKAFVRSDLHRHKAMDDGLRAYRSAPQVQLFERIERGEMKPGSTIGEPMDVAGERALADYERSLPQLGKRLPGAPPAATRVTQDRLQELQELQRKVAKGNAALRESLNEQSRLREALNRAENAGAEARRELVEHFGETATLTRMLLDRDAQVAHFKTRQRAIIRERDAAVIAAEAARVEADVQRQVAERAAAQARRQAKQQAGKQAAGQAAATHAARRIRTLEQQLADARRSAARLVAQAEELCVSTHAAETRAAEAEQRLAGLTSRISWRLTRPLRALTGMLRWRPADDGARRVVLEEIRRSGLFDPDWYLARNPDVAKSGVDPAGHYLDHGASEGRAPGPAFDARRYLVSNPDVAATGANPLLHYLRHGRAEGRIVHGCLEEAAR